MTNRSDDFNRGDTTNGIGTPSDGGSAWSQVSGTWGIASNTGYESGLTPSQAICVLESSVADVDVQVTIATQAISSGVIARETDNSNYLLLAIGNSSNDFTLFRKQAGSFVQIATAVQAISSGDVIKFNLNGTAIAGFYNGVSKVTGTSSFNQTATKHGIRVDTATGIVVRFDTFSITGLGGSVGFFAKLSLLGVGR